MNEIAAAILEKNNYCTLATVTPEGAPWASPGHFAYDLKNIYWLSHGGAVHSQNLDADQRIFITIFNSQQTVETLGDRGAVYIETQAEKLSGDAALAARDIYSDRYSDDNDRKVGEDWHMCAAPIGTLNEAKTKGQLIYFHNTEEASA